MLWRTKTPQQDLSNRARPSYLAGRSQNSLLPLINFEQQLQTQAEVKFVAVKSFPKGTCFYCTTLCGQRAFGQTSHVPQPTSDFSKSDGDPVHTRQTLLIFRKAATTSARKDAIYFTFSKCQIYQSFATKRNISTNSFPCVIMEQYSHCHCLQPLQQDV